MLTILCCPKPFRDRTEFLQANAIGSWTFLNPSPEVILLGDEEGASEFALRWGLRQVAGIQRNAYGTPRVDSVVAVGLEAATRPIACLINADIVLLQDFMDGVRRVAEEAAGGPFLAIGGRWNIQELGMLDFRNPAWSEDVRGRVKRSGWLDRKIAMDYFVFPRHVDWECPPFALGREYWDSWFVYKARRKGMPVIDMTGAVTAVHVSHGYEHIAGMREDRFLSPEVDQNRRWLGFSRRYTIGDATHALTRSGFFQRRSIWKRSIPWLMRLEGIVVHYLRDQGIPGSSLLYSALRWAKGLVVRTKR